MKKYLFLLGLIFSLSSFGQDLGQFTHVVVPEKFSFLKQADQYQLNSLTKFLFEKQGFQTFIEEEEAYLKMSPERCEGLYADVTSDSGLFRTKLTVTLKDCRNQQVFTSKEGVSRQKDYAIAYQEALREAFESIGDFNLTNNEVIVSSTPDLQERKNIREERVNENSPAEIKEAPSRVEPASEVKEESSKLPTAVNKQNESNNLKTKTENKIEESVEHQTSKASQKASEMNFSRDGRHFFLQKTNNGFNLFQEGMTEPFATLISSAAGNNFVYSSMTSKGMAHRDSDGNLVIEILKEDNSLETIIYTPKGQ